MERQRDINDMEKEIRSVFKENKRRIDEIYEKTGIGKIQKQNKKVNKTLKLIKNKIEELKSKLSKVVNIIVEKNNRRLTIDKKVTIREGDIFNYSSTKKAELSTVLSSEEFFSTISKNCTSKENKKKVSELHGIVEKTKEYLLEAERIITKKEDFYQVQDKDNKWISYNAFEDVIYKSRDKSKPTYSYYPGVDIDTYDKEDAIKILNRKKCAEEAIKRALDKYKKILNNIDICINFIQSKFVSVLISREI